MFGSKRFAARCRAVIIHEGKLLVVKHAHDANFYALPGGHLEWGEGIEECVKREVVEELGVTPVLGALLYAHTYTSGATQHIEFFFEIKNSADYRDVSRLVRTHAHEIVDMRFVSRDDDITILPKAFADDFKNNMLPNGATKFIRG